MTLIEAITILEAETGEKIASIAYYDSREEGFIYRFKGRKEIRESITVGRGVLLSKGVIMTIT